MKNKIFGFLIVLAMLFGGCTPTITPTESPLEHPPVVITDEPVNIDPAVDFAAKSGKEEFNWVITSRLDTKQDANFWGTLYTDSISDYSGAGITVNDNMAVVGTFTATTMVTSGVSLDLTGNLVVAGTSDLQGNVSSSVGAVTITDAVLVTGTAEFDGVVNFDGATDFDAAMNVDANGDFDSLSTLAIDSDSYWDSTGSVQVNDDAVVTGTLTVQGVLFPSFANETITDGELVTPTYTVYALDSAAAVTLTLQATGTEGQVLILIGDDNFTITINDTNTRTSDGNAATLGQYDVIMWVYQDAEWIQISKSANS